MQSHGITLSFHREMADSSRELVRPDITAAVSLESYPRFIEGGFQDYEGLGIKRSTADSKHVPSPRSRLLGNNVFEPPPESSRIFGNYLALRALLPNRGHRISRELGELLSAKRNATAEYCLRASC